MNCLKRNQRKFWYSNYLGKQAIIDDKGLMTGEYKVLRTEATEAHGNISVPTGKMYPELFGTDVEYDKVIIIKTLPAGMDENTTFWIDTDPENPPDYICKKVAESLNSVSIAVKKVNHAQD